MINFWATWCVPCINELPYIQQVSTEYSDLQVLTVLYDSGDTGAIATAIGIANSIGFTLPILRYNSSVQNAFGSYITGGALPTTFFINREGKLLKVVRGSHDLNAWRQEIENLL